jgi:hypothetical protein
VSAIPPSGQVLMLQEFAAILKGRFRPLAATMPPVHYWNRVHCAILYEPELAIATRKVGAYPPALVFFRHLSTAPKAGVSNGKCT